MAGPLDLLAVANGLGDGLAVVIAELAAPFRVLTFAGRDRPEQPVAVGGEQVAVVTHYPGSQAASVQVMGTKEDDIVLRGWWQDPLTLVDGGPMARLALARGLMQGQNLCSLQWGTAIMRWGRVTKVEVEYHTATRIRYEITFAVDQANEAVALAPLPISTSALVDLVSEAEQALRVLDDLAVTAGAVTTLGGVVV